MVMSAVLVVVVALVAVMPLVAHAMLYAHGSGGDGVPTRHPKSGSGSSGNTGNSNSNSGSTKQTIKHSKTVTLTNTTTTVTITKTYTQVVTQTYVVNHYIYYYMYPIIKWVFTLVNIGYEQAPGYHSVGSEELFLPGFGGGSGIFVPVYAQEAIYALNIAPSTKPVITGWYVGSTSESSSPPSLASQSVDTYLSGIQETVNTIRHQYNVTLTNTTTTITKYINDTQPSPTGTNKTGTSPTNSTSQTWECPWAVIDKVGPYGCEADSILGNVYNTSTVAIVTWNQASYQQIANMVNNALQNLGKNLPPGLLPPGVVSPPGFHNKFNHSGALVGVPIIGEPVTLPISGLGGVLSGVGNAILNGVENGWNWIAAHI